MDMLGRCISHNKGLCHKKNSILAMKDHPTSLTTSTESCGYKSCG